MLFHKLCGAIYISWEKPKLADQIQKHNDCIEKEEFIGRIESDYEMPDLLTVNVEEKHLHELVTPLM